MVITCPICGKLTAIYWPQFWVYRRGETYYCSENCLVVDRTRDIRLMNQVARERLIRKGVENMGKHRLTLEQKKKAVEIAGQGGDHLAYLKKCGAKNPSAAWVYIKKTLMNKITEDIMAIPPINAQASAEETAEKPILAEVAEKVPEITEKTDLEALPEGVYPIIKNLDFPVPDALDIMQLRSRAVPGACYTKRENPIEGGYEELMAMEWIGPLMGGQMMMLDREGWYQLIDEIRTALEQMKI